jgi:prepilin-type N-terminal cleavage/methylation domain-containing protein
MLRQRLLAARKNDEGFTLIELLIVVVVIGILAGITIFGVDAFKNDGKAAACKADTKNLEVAAQAFYAKSNYVYPTGPTAVDTAGTKFVPGYLKEEPAGTIVYAATGPVLTCP